jgi:predicted dehydrogenase
MDNNNVKVSFIGAGYMAGEHLRAFSDIANITIAGIFSRTRIKSELLALKYSVEIICDSIKELYEKTESDLVIISVSELSVKEICYEVFKYPWVCLIEKPAGYNFDDAQLIMQAAKKQNAKAFVALNRRHYSSTKYLINELKFIEGKRLIHVYDQEDIIVAWENGVPTLVIDNWMYANSIHVIDYLSFLGRGTIESVENLVRWNAKEPGFVFAKIVFSSGDIGIYEAIWNGPGPWAVTVSTQEKRWELRPLENANFQLNGSRKLELVEHHVWDSIFKPGLRAQAEEAIKAVNGQPHNLPNLNDALESMKLVKLLYS